ncbi:hypothetical protein BDA96_06G102900 [Sorghum bicolor]|uniref:Uncharacterized protein n=1 Tax=Sorghum bicolor TaxID=4558 RepID=A0A921UCX7_SORBI|nr:hypothetical protein BDA96_06G102900 [Sorghum bicolor]
MTSRTRSTPTSFQGVVSATNNLRAESEEDRTDEDREYREELGDDYSEGSYDSEGYSD